MLVDIQWYRAAEDAPGLGFESGILSGAWIDSQYDEPWAKDLGDVWDEPTPYSFHGPLVGVTYDHVCGTAEDFLLGAVFDPTLDVKYDEQGLPLCCGAPATPLAGVVVGLEVEVDAAVVPGTDCATAFIVTPGVPQMFQIPGPGQWWIGVPCVAPGSTYHKLSTIAGTWTGLADRSEGVNCAGIVGVLPLNEEGCVSWPNIFTGFVWTVYGVVSGAPLVSVEMGPGACPP